MASYWVKSGGTATGDAGRDTGTPSGSFATQGAANYYDNTEDAFNATTSPVGGDYIIVSDAHSHSYGGSIASFAGSSTLTPVTVVSVSDSNADQESAGAEEITTLDFVFSGNTVCKSMRYEVGDDFPFLTSNHSVAFQDCHLEFTGSGDRFFISADSISIFLLDTVITYTSGTTIPVFLVRAGSYVKMIGGAITSTSGNVASVIGDDSINGGGRGEFIGVDLSNVNGDLLAGIGTASSDDMISYTFQGCDLHASVTFAEETFSSPNHELSIYNCSATSSASEYQFFRREWNADIEDQDDTGIHRDETTAFDSGTKISMKVTTLASCTPENPLVLELPARFAELSTASTDTMRLYFAVANSVTLTDVNFWLQAYAPDGTNKNVYNTYTTRNADLFATGTTHTDDSGASTWLNGVSALTAHNEYRHDIATSGDVAADGYPRLFICIGEPSVTIYIDPVFDLVA